MDDASLIRVLKALADPKRFRMVQEIAASSELSCSQVGERFPLSQPAISHHLKILVDAGLLVSRQDAQHRFISVNRELLQEALALVATRLDAQVPRRPARQRTGERRQ